MTWTKLSDDFSDDCWELSDGAYRLHTEALVWSNRKLLDCRIAKSDIARCAKHPDPEFISELVDCGWWEDRGEAYVVIHHSGYQRSREQVLRQQAANRDAGKRSGRERARRRDNSLNKSLNGSLNERDGTGRAWTTKQGYGTRQRAQPERCDRRRGRRGESARVAPGSAVNRDCRDTARSTGVTTARPGLAETHSTAKRPAGVVNVAQHGAQPPRLWPS
jgi:hypothetical protein